MLDGCECDTGCHVTESVAVLNRLCGSDAIGCLVPILFWKFGQVDMSCPFRQQVRLVQNWAKAACSTGVKMRARAVCSPGKTESLMRLVLMDLAVGKLG